MSARRILFVATLAACLGACSYRKLSDLKGDGGDAPSGVDHPDATEAGVDKAPDAVTTLDASDAGDAADTGGARDSGDAGDVRTDVGPGDVAPEVTLLANGASCARDNQCTSSHCVDGVCCDGACTGQCQSCAETNNLGKCVIVSGVPRAPRTACGGTAPCAGACDGTDGMACRFPGNNVQCTAGNCSVGSVTTETHCNGAGACTTAMTSGCATNQCANGTTCSGGCSTTLPCDNGRYCDRTGICLPKKDNGQGCLADSECTNGACVDNVCCESRCGGQCQSCNEPSNAGKCVTVTGAPRAGRTPCAGTQVTCAGRCDGTSATACSYPTGQTICTAAMCSGNLSLTTASICNGAGACTTAMTNGCGSGRYCTAAACVAQLGNGATCTFSDQCSGGNCSNGICCGSGMKGCAGMGICVASNQCCGDTECPAGPTGTMPVCSAVHACAYPCATATHKDCNGACILKEQCCGDGQCPSDKPICDGTRTCVKRANGAACTTDAECLSGSCPACYRDKDGDGFGDKWGQPLAARNCGPCPSGYVADNRDCMDDSAVFSMANLVNPNADFHYPAGVPPGSPGMYTVDPRDTSPDGWDWDCDDKRTLAYPTAMDTPCSPTATCANNCPTGPPTLRVITTDTCGGAATIKGCISAPCGAGAPCTTGDVSGTPQGCR